MTTKKMVRSEIRNKRIKILRTLTLKIWKNQVIVRMMKILMEMVVRDSRDYVKVRNHQKMINSNTWIIMKPKVMMKKGIMDRRRREVKIRC